MSHVSIVDIARLAQVSPSTVSRALQITRIRPRAARRDPDAGRAAGLSSKPGGTRVGDRAHAHARRRGHRWHRSLRRGSPEGRRGPAARESGYGLLFAMSNRSPVLEIEAAEVLLDHQVDGLIVISSSARPPSMGCWHAGSTEKRAC